MKLFRKIKWKYIISEIILIVIGISIAIGLNNWNSNRKTLIEKRVALENIKSEVDDNNKELLKSAEVNQKTIEFLTKAIELYDSDDKIVAVPKYVNQLQKNFPERLIVNDSTKMKGEYTYDISIKYIINSAELSEIAWETTKINNLVSQFEFVCTKQIIAVYNLQEQFMYEQQKLNDLMLTGNINQLLDRMKRLMKLKEVLLVRYENLRNNFNNCS